MDSPFFILKRLEPWTEAYMALQPMLPPGKTVKEHLIWLRSVMDSWKIQKVNIPGPLINEHILACDLISAPEHQAHVASAPQKDKKKLKKCSGYYKFKKAPEEKREFFRELKAKRDKKRAKKEKEKKKEELDSGFAIAQVAIGFAQHALFAYKTSSS
ncbi:hypothetical protein K490DRAFT_52554 [Saccharata proteae CBS 121410]|uniref:Uncharacterized protein n=1 Tax=Saccharata proteae CBS 121410 TaxID=1314787 RepID=A0A9P4I188_9PEZI|nr:hypothetical protein K490DRAFT_52554 [Saccharata proteae CBS 121410]